MIHVTPREGLVVRDPKTLDKLPEKGAEVDDSSYWRRRELARDVEISEPKPPKSRAATRTETSA